MTNRYGISDHSSRAAVLCSSLGDDEHYRSAIDRVADRRNLNVLSIRRVLMERPADREASRFRSLE